jgi:CubicO group peptidase (beta-lactamase class C family)
MVMHRRPGLAAIVAALLLCLVSASAPIAAPQPAGTAPPVFPVPSWEPVASPEAVGFDGARLKGLGDCLKTLDTTGLMVVVGGRVLYQWGNVQEVSYLASARKSILAMLYGNYVADGTIRLERTLRDLGMSDVGGLLPIEQEATVEDLLTARSGVYHPASNGGDDTESAPPRGSQRPGTYYFYNNWDFNAAGAAFEMMTGKDIYDALEADLARPIGMEDFRRAQQHKSGDSSRSVYLAYHVWLSTRDMARIGYLMLRDGGWAGTQVIPRDWVRKITSVVTPVGQMNPTRRRRGPFGYGYLWWVWDGPAAAGAYAGAYTAMGLYGQFITVLPALDMVIAHKTAVVPDRPTRRVTTTQYLEVVRRLAAAKLP